MGVIMVVVKMDQILKILERFFTKRRQKKGVSEMVSYVLLVVIAITVAAAVFFWMRSMVPTCSENDTDCFGKGDCPDQTSMMILDYHCDSTGIDLTFKNNGMFNISGATITVTEDSSQIPEDYLNQKDNTGKPGIYFFSVPLGPGKDGVIRLARTTKAGKTLTKIQEIQVQPFVYKGKSRILCSTALINEELSSCDMTIAP